MSTLTFPIKKHLLLFANGTIAFGLSAIFFATSLSHIFWFGAIIWACQPVFWKRAKYLYQSPFAQCCLIWFAWLLLLALLYPSPYANSISFAWKHASRMLMPLALMCIPFTENDESTLMNGMIVGLILFCMYITCAQYFVWPQSNIVQLSALCALFIGLIWFKALNSKWYFFHTVAISILMVFLFFINKERTGLAVFLAMVGFIGTYYGCRHLSLKQFCVMTLGVVVALSAWVYFSPTLYDRCIMAYKEIKMFSNGVILTSVGARLAFYGLVIDILHLYPALGLGLGGFEVYFPTTELGKLYYVSDFQVTNPHQNFLSILADQGIAGFIVFSAIMIRLFFMESKNKMAWLCIWISFYIGGLINSFWLDRQMIIICFVMFALLAKPLQRMPVNERYFSQG